MTRHRFSVDGAELEVETTPRHGELENHRDRNLLTRVACSPDCPPGLAKKHNGCMPPGQAKKLYRGQRWQGTYGNRYTFGQIPYDLRRRYDLDPTDRYYYGNGYLYQVDPRTLLVQQVISALLR